jgi:hypothetical protein
MYVISLQIFCNALIIRTYRRKSAMWVCAKKLHGAKHFKKSLPDKISSFVG